MRSKRVKFMLFLTLGLACISAGNAQSAELVDELKTCAKVTDRNARFACYENLGKRALENETAAERSSAEIIAQPEAAAVPVAIGTTTNTVALPDDLGSASIDDPSQSTEKQNRSLLTSCKKGADQQWYFYFENGQVWKQIDSHRLSFRECNFIATITKDGFGYKMQIESVNKKFRVTRKR